ncbi:MAG: RecQ family ATP-dependent DNA helicase, partial [Solirubrobacterales bacterium]
MLSHGERADALLHELGYAQWRDGQREAVIAALEGRDSLIVMPTGGGKSLCYQLPGLASEELTIVVSPLIALMRDQWGKLNAGGHRVTMITSGMEDWEASESLEMVRGDARIVYCAPERFASNVFLEALSHRKVDLIAVDEAHCVSEWGHDFRPDYLRIGPLVERLGSPTVLALTATASPPVREEIVERLRMRDPELIIRGFDRPNIRLEVDHHHDENRKRRALVERVAALDRPGIVYTATRKLAEEVAGELEEAGLRARPYHAGLAKSERNEAQEAFMDDELDVIAATTAFGMGVDKPNVRFVFHSEPSDSVDSYYQEVGRAGRDGSDARALLFYRAEDLGIRRFFAGGSR